MQASHPEKTWILAGGLSPKNITEALAQTKAKVVDLSSGVEISLDGEGSIKVTSVG